jgi:murein DD-endopeptidase MepM/ murein hydrolase activator NlpD
MRNFLTASGSSSLVRLSVVALLGGTAAACSSDTGRFSDPNASPFSASAGAPSYTGSVAAAPTGVVQQAPMGGPMGSQVAAAPLASPSAPPYPAPYGSTSAPAYPAPYGAPQQLASAAPNYPVAAAAPTSYPAAAPVSATQPLYGAQPQQLAPQAAAPRAPQMAAAGGGSHVVKPGETLSSIARNYGVPRGTLAAANGLDINAQVQIGRTLTVPGAGAATNPVAAAPKPATTPVVAAAPHPAASPVATAPVAAKPAAVATAPATPAPVAVEKPQTIAAVKPAETPDDIRTSSGTQFRWPVRGRVISTFGPKPGGQQNEGINVSVPEGTAVKAAEDGVVAYAGSELKGYGNLVLIKHADGYVTAYAHNSELDVKKGDTVKRGQVIAKAGQTGNVTSPQVHFEIRKGSQPVDPSQYLAGL